MQSKMGVVTEAVRHGAGLVDEDAVAAFASSVNDLNPRYQAGTATPLLFTAGLVLADYHEVHDALAAASGVRDWSLSVHGQHDVTYFHPVLPWTRCRWSVWGRSVQRSKGGVLLTVGVRITDEAGTALVEHLWTTFYLGGTVSREMGPPVPDHTFPPGVRSVPPMRTAVTVDRDQAFRFGGATGDRAPHAIDDDRARSEGFPGKILQGMCTFSMASAVLVDTLAGGEPMRVRRLAVRFSAPTRPRGELTVDTWGIGDPGRPDGARAYAFEAAQGGAAVLRHGRLEILDRAC